MLTTDQQKEKVSGSTPWDQLCTGDRTSGQMVILRHMLSSENVINLNCIYSLCSIEILHNLTQLDHFFHPQET